MSTSKMHLEVTESGIDNVSNKVVKLSDRVKAASGTVNKLGTSVEKVGGRSTMVAADGFKDFAESMARGEGVAAALTSTIGPLSSGLLGLGSILSVGLAAAIPFVIMGLVSLIGESKTTKEVSDELKASTDALTEAQKNALMTTAQLRTEFGAWAGEMQVLNELMLKVAQADALEKSNQALEKLFSITPKDFIEGVAQWMHGLEQTAQAVDDLQQKWGFTAEAAQQFIDTQKELAKTDDIQERARIAAQLLDIMNAQNKEAADLTETERESIVVLEQMVRAGEQMSSTLAASAGNASVLAGEMGNVAIAARNAMAAVDGILGGIEAKIADTKARIRALNAGIEEGAGAALVQQVDADLKAGKLTADQAAAAYEEAIAKSKELKGLTDSLNRNRNPQQFGPPAPPPVTASSRGPASGGGGGGGTSPMKQLEEDAKAADVQIDETKSGFTQFYDNVKAETESLGDTWTSAFQGMEDAFVEFVKTGKLDFSSLVDSMISDLARYAFKQAAMGLMNGILPGIFGSSNALSTSIRPMPRPSWNGNVISQPTKFFANGGIASMSEKGAEAILPLQRNARGQLGVYADTGSGGGGNVININTTINTESSGDPKQDGEQMARTFNKIIENKIIDVMSKQRNQRQGGLYAR